MVLVILVETTLTGENATTDRDVTSERALLV